MPDFFIMKRRVFDYLIIIRSLRTIVPGLVTHEAATQGMCGRMCPPTFDEVLDIGLERTNCAQAQLLERKGI